MLVYQGISVDFYMCERKHIRKPFAFQSNIGVPVEFSDQSQDLRETQNPTIKEQQYGRNSAPSALRIRPSPDIRTRSLASKKKAHGGDAAPMENDPFIDGLPITNGDFPWLC